MSVYRVEMKSSSAGHVYFRHPNLVITVRLDVLTLTYLHNAARPSAATLGERPPAGILFNTVLKYSFQTYLALIIIIIVFLSTVQGLLLPTWINFNLNMCK